MACYLTLPFARPFFLDALILPNCPTQAKTGLEWATRQTFGVLGLYLYDYGVNQA
jgi:hypothetical protein